jgi:hypothetical protein
MLALEQLVDSGRFQPELLERLLERGQAPDRVARRLAGTVGQGLDRPTLLTRLDHEVSQALEEVGEVVGSKLALAKVGCRADGRTGRVRHLLVVRLSAANGSERCVMSSAAGLE